MLSTLAVFGYIAALMAPAMCCLPKEYKTMNGECCPMCHEGSVVRRDCTEQSGTRCIPCVNGTYMNQPNGLSNCFLCTSCDQGHGLFSQKWCTATTDTICDVLSGYFCKDWMDGSGCSLAKTHTPCPPGHRVKEPGTSRTDTVCELCQPGHFSQDGLNCTAWTSCSETQVEIKEGSNSSDVVCGAASRERFYYIPFIMATLLSLALVIAGTLSQKNRDLCSVTLAHRKRLARLNDAVRHFGIQLSRPEPA
ncbi:tumor necrosis factor receptor superfamily member 14-like isoform X2 [Sebastes umbrosus]|uniref:tumor necrosis factor receptor superfamily member 14-like isoform X2 n=1 Tax=Sebastes umbrosus TaxID=72105 RepID=UPI00189D7E5A|nr:tumor necrosis factor receptor superfamily member 14-like isoform X2 [Sebastes umbrosus]